MELEGLDELRRMGTGILELVETLGDESKFRSMEDDKGSLLVELSLKVEEIGGKIDEYDDLVSIACATCTVEASGFSVSKISLSWGKTAFSFTFGGFGR